MISSLSFNTLLVPLRTILLPRYSGRLLLLVSWSFLLGLLFVKRWTLMTVPGPPSLLGPLSGSVSCALGEGKLMLISFSIVTLCGNYGHVFLIYPVVIGCHPTVENSLSSLLMRGEWGKRLFHCGKESSLLVYGVFGSLPTLQSLTVGTLPTLNFGRGLFF